MLQEKDWHWEYIFIRIFFFSYFLFVLAIGVCSDKVFEKFWKIHVIHVIFEKFLASKGQFKINLSGVWQKAKYFCLQLMAM